MKNQIKFLVLAMLLTLLQACGGDSSAEKEISSLDTNTPDGALMAAIQAVKHNDIKALMQASISSEEYEAIIQEFEKSKASPSEEDKAQFAQTMGMLTADGAVDQLMALATPQLEQVRAQLPMMLMMGKGMLTQAIQANADIPTEQKESLTKIANTFMDFVSENDILSEEVTRKAIGAAVQTAKDLKMTSLDELQNMNFDQAMAKASIVMAGTKNILGAYGVSLDNVLDTIKISNIVENGDNANMKLGYELLGETFSQEIKMLKKDGKWISEK